MAQLIVCRGLPASGKSTWARRIVAKDASFVRVNRDDLRGMIHDNVWNGKREKTTVTARDALISTFLTLGKSVICDDTNLDPKVMDGLKAIAKAHGVSFSIEDFTHVDKEVCIERDAKREASVGKDVIMRMWRQHLKPEPIVQPIGAQPIIICDMDGTLSLLGDRSPYDEESCADDEPNWPVLQMVNSYLRDNPDVGLAIFSGRDEGRGRSGTEEWVAKYLAVEPMFIAMRPANDQRKDSIIKRELFDAYVNGRYFVNFVVDDRKQVVEMWRDDLGIPTFQVEWGEF